MAFDADAILTLEALQSLIASMLDCCASEDWQRLSLLDSERRELLEKIPAKQTYSDTNSEIPENMAVARLIDSILEQDRQLQVQIRENRDTLASSSINQQTLKSVRQNYLANESL